MTTDTKPWGVLGITDDPRPPIVCKAKIGRQVERNGKTYPERLDYIVFVEPQTGRQIPEFQEVFGEKPTSFKALLAGDTLDQNIDVAWKRYGKQGLKCRGDGVSGIDRETGERRECAGTYNFEDQEQHRCPFARPGTRDGKKLPPECKPVLSMRLVVPQIPGLGVVQLDTGGVASSIQTLVWQLRMIERQTRGHMAGIAVQMSIRAFPDKFGNAAYSWQLTPLRAHEAEELRGNMEMLTRIDGQVPQDLPALEEAADPDIYGLPAPSSDDDIPFDTADADPIDVEPEAEPPEELISIIAGAEALFRMATKRVSAPPAKIEAIRQTQFDNRAHAAQTGNWDGYHRWLQSQITKLNREAEKAQGALM